MPLEIRVGLVSQRPVTAFWPGRNVRCRNRQGSVISAQQLGNGITGLGQQEIHCSRGPVRLNQQRYLGAVSLFKADRDWLAVISWIWKPMWPVVGAEMRQWHRKPWRKPSPHAPMPGSSCKTSNWAYHLGDTTRRSSGETSTSQASRSATWDTRGIILSYGGGIVESLYASTAQVSAEAHGHLGASMSQTGAQHLAQQGLPFNAILGRYYAGASLARLKRHDQ